MRQSWLVLLGALNGCGSEEGGGHTAPPTDSGAGQDGAADGFTEAMPDAASDSPGAISYELSFVRGDAAELPGFTAELRSSYSDGSPAPADDVVISASRGEAVGLLDSSPGLYKQVFEPDGIGTGEYEVTATVDGDIVAVRTALVMKTVGERWGQPQKVEGLVNTEGWEDGANITPDGQYLLVHYLPITASCLLQANPDVNSPECSHARGPVSAPERPDMPGADRVASDGTIQHGCPSIGIPSLPIPLPPNTFWGFHRQPDGSFAEPFYIAFEGIDACVSPFGITTVVGGSEAPTLLFAFDNPFDNDPPNTDTQGDLFALSEASLGQNIVLGRYALESDEIVLNDFGATMIASTGAGHFGNPAGFVDSAGRVQVWYDNESLPEEQRNLGALVFDPGVFPGGVASPPADLPAPFGVDGVAEIQPFFDGQEALFRQGWDIVAVPFEGGDIFDASSWAAASPIISSDVDAFTAQTAGAIVTTGEPTKSKVGGRTEIYFVYGVVEDDGTLDLNVGVITER